MRHSTRKKSTKVVNILYGENIQAFGNCSHKNLTGEADLAG